MWISLTLRTIEIIKNHFNGKWGVGDSRKPQNTLTLYINAPYASDEFELKLPELSRAEKVPSRAKLGHFNFRAETKLTICISISSKF